MNDKELKELALKDKMKAIWVYAKEHKVSLIESKSYIEKLLIEK